MSRWVYKGLYKEYWHLTSFIKGANDQIWLESKRGFGDAEIKIYNGNKAMFAANDQQQ